MIKIYFLLIFSCLSTYVFAQDIKVPSRILFADRVFVLDNDAMTKVQERFDGIVNNAETYQEVKARASVYFTWIERVFEEEGLPFDFKYLAILESNLQNDKSVRKDGLGFWQITKNQTKEINIKIDKNVDERQHFLLASEGIAKFFNVRKIASKNWILALLSKEMELKEITKMIEKNPKMVADKEFLLSKESPVFLLNFVATLLAYQNHESNTKIVIVPYKIRQEQKISEVAKKFNIDENLLTSYNLWLKASKAEVGTSLILPISFEKVQEIEQKISEEAEKEISEIEYPVLTEKKIEKNFVFYKANSLKAIEAKTNSKIDDLLKIAKISKDKLLSFNDLTNLENVLKKDYIFYLESKSDKAPIAETVVSNEDLWTISQKFGIKKAKILEYNRMKEGDQLEGRRLWLQQIRPENVEAEFVSLATPAPIFTYDTLYDNIQNPIEEKETLQNIACVYGVSADSLRKLNGKEADVIEAGETLIIGKFIRAISIAHVVQKTETPETVAKLHSLAFFPENETFKVGEKLVFKKEFSVPDSISTYHKVRIGDSMAGLADMYCTTSESIMTLNKKTDIGINVGEKILVRKTKNEIIRKKIDQVKTEIAQNSGGLLQPVISENSFTIPNNSNSEMAEFHAVQPKEGLFTISKMYQISIKDLYQLNGLDANSKLNIGQKIRLKATAVKDSVIKTVSDSTTKIVAKADSVIAKIEIKTDKFHIVKDKETVFGIAKQYGLTTDQLLMINQKAITIRANDTLFLPNNTQKTVDQNAKTHTVSASEGMYAIAKMYNISWTDLATFNNLDRNAKLTAGQVLRLTAPENPAPNPNVIGSQTVSQNDFTNVNQNTNVPTVNSASSRSENPASITLEITKGAKTNVKTVSVPVVVPKVEEKPVEVKVEPVVEVQQTPEVNPNANVGAPVPVPDNAPEGSFYEMGFGESLEGVSKKLNISLDDLAKWNGLEKGFGGEAGRKIWIKDPKK